MWHEARRREKATQKLFIEHKKRAEKRREENRIDPNSLLQVHGIKSKLHLDPNIYKQAAKSLVAWQGDKSVTIDRFDVRATLTSIPRGPDPSRSASASRNTVIDADQTETMKKVLDYERYRLVIQNDLSKVPEEFRLKLVAKSDVASDATLRKLRNNKFGTSGETTISNAKQFTTSQRTEPKSRANVGPNYSSVPPPSSLSDRHESIDVQDDQQETLAHESALQIMESDEFNNFDLDSVNIAQFEAKKLEQLAKRYAFNERELTLLTQADQQEISLSKLLAQLDKANKKESSNAKNSLEVNSDQIYGPALPPELAQTVRGSSSSSSEGGDSPIAQRSPSGGDIPLRNESEAKEDDTKERLRAESPVNDSTSKLNVTESTTKSIELPKSIIERLPSSLSGSSDDEKDKSHPVKSRHRQQQEPRRASTPLAYKRNRRSSRSLSCERRSSQTSNHRTRSSRNLSRHRSRSSSSSSRSSRSSSRSRSHRSRHRRREEYNKRRRHR